MGKTIENRQQGGKSALLEQLKKVPIVSVACDRTGISRATYYRWRAEDQDFTAATNEAIADGVAMVNDMAESQLLAAIREGNITSIFYWLNHRHPSYATKVKIDATHRVLDEKLTPEQQAMVETALRLSGIKEISDGKE